jgi:carboxypeptidase family protein/TonB-dependent receptor-like protein
MRCLCGSLCLLLVPASAAFAQRGELLARAVEPLPATATLSGTVVDQNDIVVRDASVSVNDSTSSLKRQVLTGPDGRFAVPHLLPGNYTVVVEHEGFATTRIDEVSIESTGQLALTIHLRKNVADLSTLSRQVVENFPLNGRSLQPLISLSPGIVSTKATFGEQGQFSANGQRANANYFTIDGVSANIGVAAGAQGLGQSGGGSLPGLSALGSTNTLASIDALQELKIQTNAFAPEFGRTPGAQVALTTRSGTNQFRGTVFDYFRGGALGSNDWFANRSGLKPPALKQNDFGGVFGGPIVRDRTFFFASYEGLRLQVPQVTTRDVPSNATRAAAGAELRPFFNAFPLPNGPESGRGLAGFTAEYRDTAAFDAASIRIDHRVSENLNLFGRYSYAPSEALLRGVNTSLNSSVRLLFGAQTLTIGTTQMFTPRVVNDLRANYSRTRGGKFFDLDDFGGAIPLPDSLALPLSTSRKDALLSFDLGGGVGFIFGKDAENFQEQFNLVEKLALSLDSHQLKFGMDYRRLSPTYTHWRVHQVANFNGVAPAVQGNASSVLVQSQDDVGLISNNFSAYAQDSWRISPRIDLTYGLRWEFNPPPSVRSSTGNVRAPFTVIGLDSPASLSLAPAGTPLYETTFGNFAPRLGLALELMRHPRHETILRGGFGLFYDLGTGPLANIASSFPFQRRRLFSPSSFPLDPSQVTPIPFSLDPPAGVIRASDPNLKLPRTFHWSVSVEQYFGSNQTLSASYVGAAGRRLLRTELLKDPTPNFSQVYVTTNQASSDYHALQLQFDRRLARGLQARVAYTWSHSIDIASSDSAVQPPAIKTDPQLDRGAADFDVRHAFNAAVTYDLPYRVSWPLGRKLFRDWSADVVVGARTATPLDVFFRRDLGFGFFNLRPNLLSGVPLYLADPSAPGGRVINHAAFAFSGTPRHGTLGRNVLRGFAASQVDFALRRHVDITERFRLQFRAEIFNLFNHPNFGDPVGDLDNSRDFGRSTALLGRSLGSVGNGGLNPAFQTGGPRSVQLSLRFHF